MSETVKTEITDEFLCKYMPMADELLLQSVRKGPRHEFSDRFERHMDRLIRAERHSKTYRVVTGICKRVALFFVAALLAGLTVTMSVSALREKFFELIRSYREGGLWEMHFQFDSETDELGMHIKDTTYIPEGYMLKEYNYEEHDWREYYENVDGEFIMVENIHLFSGMTMLMDSEYDVEEKIMIQGHEVILLTRYDRYYVLYWYEENMLYEVYTSIRVPKEEVIKVAEGMTDRK